MIFPWISETTEILFICKKTQTDSLDETIFRKAEEISAASYALDLSNPGAVSKLTKTDRFFR